MKRSWQAGLLTGAIAGLAVFAFSRTMLAQSGATTPAGRVVCVNVIRVMNEYQRQKDLIEEMNKYKEKVEAEDLQRKQKIDTLQAELDKMNPDDPTMVQRMREMLTAQIDYKNWRDLKQMDTAREVGLWSIRLYKEVVKATEDIARREGYDLVFYRGQFETVSMDPDVIKEQIRSLHLIYANPTTDITQTVLDKLNAEYRAQPKQQMLMQTP